MNPNSWIDIKATIFSAEYVEPNGTEGRPFWKVTYYYRVGEENYSGHFTTFETDNEVDYQKNDLLSVQYEASRPDHSKVPGAVTYWSKAWPFFAIGAAIGLVVLIISIFKH